jgi:hypothetical protein
MNQTNEQGLATIAALEEAVCEISARIGELLHLTGGPGVRVAGCR